MLPCKLLNSLYDFLLDHGFTDTEASETCTRFDCGMYMPPETLSLVRKWMDGRLTGSTTT